MAGWRCCATKRYRTPSQVRVKYWSGYGRGALNHIDLWQRRGIPGVPLPHCPGSDIAGEVVRGEPHGVAEGQRVLVQPGISCGRCVACLGGEDNLCRSYGLVGYQSEGGYAELVTVPVENIVPIPDRIGFVEAAAFPLTFLTAWHMLVTRAEPATW